MSAPGNETAKHNNYSSSNLTTPIAVITPIALSVFSVVHNIELDTLQSLIETSQAVSGNGYFFKFIDDWITESTLLSLLKRFANWLRSKIFPGEETDEALLAKEKSGPETATPFGDVPPQKTKKPYEKIGLLFGLLAAIGVSIATLVTDKFIHPVKAVYSCLSYLMLFIGNMSLYAGLGNRTGRILNKFAEMKNNIGAKLKHSENINYTLAIAGGLLMSAAIVGTLHFLTGGLSTLLGIAIFGSCASSAGYIGRVFDFFFGHRSIGGLFSAKTTESPAQTTEPVRRKVNFENVLTTAGVILGAAVATALVCTGLTFCPFLIPAIACAPIAAIMTYSACISAFGGLFNRIGFALDKFRSNKSNKPATEEVPAAKTKSEPDATPAASLPRPSFAFSFFRTNAAPARNKEVSIAPTRQLL